jgi:hypothetical protein
VQWSGMIHFRVCHIDLERALLVSRIFPAGYRDVRARLFASLLEIFVLSCPVSGEVSAPCRAPVNKRADFKTEPRTAFRFSTIRFGQPGGL